MDDSLRLPVASKVDGDMLHLRTQTIWEIKGFDFDRLDTYLDILDVNPLVSRLQLQ